MFPLVGSGLWGFWYPRRIYRIAIGGAGADFVAVAFARVVASSHESRYLRPRPAPEDSTLSDWPISERLREYLDVQYELVRVLGTGGMGTVLLANERALERMVAIKVLRVEKATDAEARERFRREARSAAKLTHPNIVPLLTFGDVGGELYFVMGYVDGESLATRLERMGRLTPEEASRRLAELADALDYAHKAGIVHRDLKPENVLLDRGSGRAMLTDFGIARELGTETSLTSTGIIVGTPHFMSPEQASGERAIDGRSDIYSLGVIGYRMVSGTLPFGGTNVREVIYQHLTATPAPLPESIVESSPALAAALARALAKEPAARWSTGAVMASALRSDQDEEVLPDDLESLDGVYGRIVLIFTVLGAGLLLMPAVGISSGSLRDDVLSALAMPLIAAGVLTGLLRFDRWRYPGTADLRARVGFRPPRWWSVWWPRRYRRPGDVWDRLPTEMRVLRWGNLASLAVFLPLMAAGMLWYAIDDHRFQAAYFIANNRPLVNAIVAGVLTLTFGLLAATVLVVRRLCRRLGIERKHFEQLQSAPNADARWKHPRYAALLLPRGHAAGASPASTGQLVSSLRAAGVVLPDGLTEARAAVDAAERELDRELKQLREVVTTAETKRLDRQLANLSSGDPQLRSILESQRALYARTESRIGELGALRARLDAQQALLRQQLIVLRDLAPSGVDLSEISGRIRAVNADLKALAEGLVEV